MMYLHFCTLYNINNNKNKQKVYLDKFQAGLDHRLAWSPKKCEEEKGTLRNSLISDKQTNSVATLLHYV